MDPPETPPPHIPYQAYKSKRHSRSTSYTHLTPNVSPPPVSRPVSSTPSPSPSPPSLSKEKELLVYEVAPDSNSTINSSPLPLAIVLNSPPSNGEIKVPISAPTSPVISNGNGHSLQTPEPIQLSNPTDPPASPLSTETVKEARSPDTSIDTDTKPLNGVIDSAQNQTASSPTSTVSSVSIPGSPSSSASSSTSTSNIPAPKPPPTRKTSTFRHIPLRNATSPFHPSPLRPPGAGTHSRTTSTSSSISYLTIPESNAIQSRPDRSRIPSLSSVTSATSSADIDQRRRLSSMPAAPDSSMTSLAVHDRRHSTLIPAPQQPELAPPQRSSSLRPQATTSNSSHSTPQSTPTPTPIPTPPPLTTTLSSSSVHSHSNSNSRTNSPTTTPPPSTFAHRPTIPHNRQSIAPYRPGFQPKGVYRPRTDEFIDLRRAIRDGTADGSGQGIAARIERTKLERRLEKLIALHFSEDGGKGKERESGKEGVKGSNQLRPGMPPNRRASSFFDLDLSDLKNMDASGLWKGMLLQGQGGKSDARASEQRITPWQEDSSVSKCPLCAASFHPLTNRKHHCRLCGQIICSLPVKHPQRPVTCSLLFVVDPKTRKIEEVGEGVDYGVKKRRGGSIGSQAGVVSKDGKLIKPKEEEEEDKFLKGVRICRECRPILLRQQHQQEVLHVPTFAKLYEVFIALEKEIEDSLPQFQELILSLNHEDQPTKEASAARKRLLSAFAQYDALSKRIRHLPCSGGPGSSQDRVQIAVMTRANLFLQKNMFPLQSLPTPKPKTKGSASTASPATADDGEGPLIDPDSAVAHALQPLLEQEALLESFVEEAKAQRKFEDVKTLKTNLKEIQAEIEKMLANAEGGMHGERIGKGNSKGKGKVAVGR